LNICRPCAELRGRGPWMSAPIVLMWTS